MIRRIGANEHRRMPWRNGGGTTAEILVEPAAPSSSRGASPFRYRLSIADVAVDGPFSAFAGCDRHIVLLEGAGMTLDCGAHGTIELARRAPRSFSGDWDVSGRLSAGPVRDLNLIVDRAADDSSLEIRTIDAPVTLAVPPSGTCIVHVLEGRIDGAEATDTVVADATFELVPRGVAVVAVARVAPKPTVTTPRARE